jgi:hypothetical protein
MISIPIAWTLIFGPGGPVQIENPNDSEFGVTRPIAATLTARRRSVATLADTFNYVRRVGIRNNARLFFYVLNGTDRRIPFVTTPASGDQYNGA